MLNTDKTEAMIVGTASRVGQIETGSIPILDSGISFQSSVKYLECSSWSHIIYDIWRSSFLS